MKLTWHNYRYYPYEKQLALREVTALLAPAEYLETSDGLQLIGTSNQHEAQRLVYFSEARENGLALRTAQTRLEQSANSGRSRQATRYSVHGIHEYKGKFNPQVAKALLNIIGIRSNDRVLDPFCGSGTTLVECAHLGAVGVGMDLNPLAVMIANAKLLALRTPASSLLALLDRIEEMLSDDILKPAQTEVDERSAYLANWFEADILSEIEQILAVVRNVAGKYAPVFLIIISNLLREYSLQDPADLRIRRRTTPTPEQSVRKAFASAARAVIGKLALAQPITGTENNLSRAVLADIRTASRSSDERLFDAAITSPPYATALPYIDTQRLSLVWLGLIEPKEIAALEADLIGSREIRGVSRQKLALQMVNNSADLPERQIAFCRHLHGRLHPDDGFRRKAVPILMYRYFSGMKASFSAVFLRLKPGGTYALIVGHNHTVLGGVREDIDTPRHLADIAHDVGWRVQELFPLQTYRRYGLHASNAVEGETLIFLKKP